MIAVVCHDAGGAEIISSFLRRGELDYRAAVAGPAAEIFVRKLPGFQNEAREEILREADFLLCGTSVPSTFELEAISLARTAGLRSVALLDHWINYRERFSRDGRVTLPDELWVVDETAERTAAELFPQLRVTRIDNPYRLDVLENLRGRAAARPADARGAVRTALYVTEPTSEHAQRMYGDPAYWGYTETGALEWFLACATALDPALGRIVIRPHPSERRDKYTFALARAPLAVEFSVARDLLQDIAEADLVSGCNSMAMVVAAWAGKRVVCCIPPGGRGFSLPALGIEFAADHPACLACLIRGRIA